jgi:hypothetical protein
MIRSILNRVSERSVLAGAFQKAIVVSLLGVLAAVGGCSVKASGGGDLGDSCEFDDDCASNFCDLGDGADVCTQNCAFHSDCGCASGTTDADISAGSCDVACNPSLLLCERVCSGSASVCDGHSLCDDTGFGYALCE